MLRRKAVLKREHVKPGSQRQLAGQNAGVPQLAAGVAAAVAVQNGVAAVMAVLQADPLGGDAPHCQAVAADADARRDEPRKQLLRGSLALQILGRRRGVVADAVHGLDGPHHRAEVVGVLLLLGHQRFDDSFEPLAQIVFSSGHGSSLQLGQQPRPYGAQQRRMCGGQAAQAVDFVQRRENPTPGIAIVNQF